MIDLISVTDALVNGDIETASRSTRLLLESEPNNVKALNLQSRIALLQHDVAESVKAAQRAIEIDPGCADAHVSLIEAALFSGRETLAIETATRLSELPNVSRSGAILVNKVLADHQAPDVQGRASAMIRKLAEGGSPRVRLEAARMSLRAKDPASALDCIAPVVEADPTSITALTLQANCFRQLRDGPSLARAAGRIEALDPAAVQPFVRPLIKLGEYVAVAGIVSRRTGSAPDLESDVEQIVTGLRRTARLASKADHDAEEIERLRALLTLRPDDEPSLRRLNSIRAKMFTTAKTALRDGDEAGGNGRLSDLHRLFPEDEKAAALLATAYEARQDWAAALDVWRTTSAHAAEPKQMLKRAARAATNAGDFAAAVTLYDGLARLSPPSDWVEVRRASAIKRLTTQAGARLSESDPVDTAELVRPLVGRDHDGAQRVVTRWLRSALRAFQASRSAKDHGRTLSLATTILSVDGDNTLTHGDPHAWIQIGNCFLVSRQSDKAASAFEKALELSPSHPTALALLSRLRTQKSAREKSPVDA